MMKKYISAALIALAAVTSCIESPSDLAIKDGGNALKVRFSTPELEVKSGNDTPDFYAYIPTELAAGNVSPIGYTDLNSEGYYLYNLPEGTTEVVFSNISNSTEVVIGKDESQNTTFSIADETPLMDEDILYGMVSGMNDKSSTYSVDIKRLTAKLSHYFYMVDADGNPLATDKIANIGISYTNIGKSLSINSEGEMAVGHYDGGISYGYSDMADEDGHVFTKSIIPSTLIPTMRVTIQFKDGTDKVYTQELTKAFEANHHYRVTLRLKKNEW